MPVRYGWDEVTNEWLPSSMLSSARYPGENADRWELPPEIKQDFTRLNSIIERKYPLEWLKVCAFYNKMFPTLKTSQWAGTAYNAGPFTEQDQERSDTGTGLSCNYLKQIIDQIVSRLGTVTFEPMLTADVPTLEYVIYKEGVERALRRFTRGEDVNRTTLECFHDAAVVGYSHVFMDPFTHRQFKANDYEVGIFDSQYSHRNIKQALYRNYAFPITSLAPYLKGAPEDARKKVVEGCNGRDAVDFKIYFDCPERLAWAVIGGTALPPIKYPFDTVMMKTMEWDLGFSRVTSTSLFDLLYPVQREHNRIMAKILQHIRMYKGSVPVFWDDVGLEFKAMSNGSGEALYLSNHRPIPEMMDVFNPTPLDPALPAEATARKTEMYELAGIQQTTFDMENVRAAASIVALSQTWDAVFQSQMDGKARFVSGRFEMEAQYRAVMGIGDEPGVDWKEVWETLQRADIKMNPVTVTSPLGEKGTAPDEPVPDYLAMQSARTVVGILKGDVDFDGMGYAVDATQIKIDTALAMVRLNALGIPVPETAERFMIDAYLDDVRSGSIRLGENVLQL